MYCKSSLRALTLEEFTGMSVMESSEELITKKWAVDNRLVPQSLKISTAPFPDMKWTTEVGS